MNPYHDRRGRFTTASGAHTRTGESAPQYGRGKPNSPNPKTMLGLPDDNGRWKYKLIEKKDVGGQTYYDWEVAPASAPASKTIVKGDEKRTLYYDPSLTDVVKTDTGYLATTKENKLSSIAKDEGLIWRGMSTEEYHAAKANGYIESRGSYNVGGQPQSGKTYFSTSPDQAAAYATWYAPDQFKPTFSHPAYVVGIPDQPRLPREGGEEVGVPGRIPFGSARKVFKGKVFAVAPGRQGAYQDGSRVTEAGSSKTNSLITWSEHK